MLLVFCDPVFSCLEIHSPAVFPIMGLAGEAVESVPRVAVLQAFDLEIFK